MAGVADRVAILGLINVATGIGVVLSRDGAIVGVSVLGMLAATRGAYVRGLRVAEQVTDAIVLRFARHAALADLRDIERIGPARLQAIMAREADALLESTSTVVLALPAAMTVAVTLLWLAVERPEILVLTAGIAALSAALPRSGLGAVLASSSQAAEAEAGFDDASDRAGSGAMLHTLEGERRGAIRERSIWSAVDRAARNWSIAGQTYVDFAAWHQWLGFVLVVLLIEFAPSDPALGNWGVAGLLVVATLSSAGKAMAALPALCRAGESTGRLDTAASSLSPAGQLAVLRPPPWCAIEFRSVTYVYRDAEGAALATVGPLDFRLCRGEAVALMGARGSGRTTLTRLLSGLYPPSEGGIFLDGHPASPALLRGLCGGVMSGFHRVARLREPAVADRTRIEALLEDFELGRLVRLDGGGRVLPDLTAGQQTRLAIVSAELDDRHIRIYDDCSVGQEPRFRERFLEILRRIALAPDYTLLIVGDDDAPRPSELAGLVDRFVWMGDGRILAGAPGSP